MFRAIALLLSWAFLSIVSVNASHLNHLDGKGFVESFINAYELSPEGRYTHEYHPFLLQYTSQSLDELEQHLGGAGMHLDGRLVIMGYEEAAMPQYYTNFAQERINDEAMRKNNAGWSLKLHNYFGFMTGFLFKQLPKLHQKLPGLVDPAFQHIDAHMVHLFQDGASILQEHAFGQALPFLMQQELHMLKLLAKKDTRGALTALERFWVALHQRAFRVGNQQIAGTQDVLFSIEYIRHLQRSPLPLHAFFTGPDITYPIEVTLKQGAGATLHAQHFVELFTKHLKPVQDEPTVYIFCSFVDGVGKSTMLGNVKNWMRHGADVRSFGHVDNSSSQLAEVFPFAPNVFIADLPAQVSHFTYKPDGKVFVDAATELDEPALAQLRAHVAANHDALVKDYEVALEEVTDCIAQEGHFAAMLQDPERPHALFLNNVVLLGKQQTNRWIPFFFNDQPYLFRDVKPYEFRCLMPLGNVRSEGLKNIEADQMLFTNGVRFPYKFSYFMQDLATRLQEQGVKHVRFVDFLSMYPRSSRENIRINYLLQQMAYLRPSFSPHQSLYKDFVSGGELLYTLMTPSLRKPIVDGFTHEALTRYALFTSLWSVASETLTELSLERMTATLRDELARHAPLTNHVRECVQQKIAREQHHLDNVYGQSKAFVNVQLTSIPAIAQLSSQLSEFFMHEVTDSFSAMLWEPMQCVPAVTKHVLDGERLPDRDVQPVTAGSGASVRPLYLLHTACKNADVLTPAVRMLRACWYSQILNVLYADGMNADDKIDLSCHWMRGIPLQLVPAGQQYESVAPTVFALAQPWYTPCLPESVKQAALPRAAFKGFEFQLNKPEAYTSIEDMLYRLNWETKATNMGLFGFDCVLRNRDGQDTHHYQGSVSSVVQKHHNATSVTTVLPTTDLWDRVQEDRWWPVDRKVLRQDAYQNGSFDDLVRARRTGQQLKPAKSWLRPVYVLPEARKPVVRMVVRLLATLEMVLKDPDADVVVRMGNQEDFKAALKLLEMIVLPQYCNLYVDGPLFDDYDLVEPYPSWSAWEQYAS